MLCIDEQEIGSKSYIWKQYQEDIIINMFIVNPENYASKIDNIINELGATKINFSIIINDSEIKLLTYLIQKKQENRNEKYRLLYQLVEKHRLKITTDFDTTFVGEIKSIEEKDTILCIEYPNKIKEYFLYISLNTANKTGRSPIEQNWLLKLIRTKLFSIIISQFYKGKRGQKKEAYWSLAIIARSRDKNDIIKAKKIFSALINCNEDSNCKLEFKFLTKKQLLQRVANFRLLVPVNKQHGHFFSFFDISKMLIKLQDSEDTDRPIVTETYQALKRENKSGKQGQPPINYKERQLVSRNLNNYNKDDTSTSIINQTANNSLLNPTILELIPKPQKIIKKITNEDIKNSLIKNFKTYGFNETIIFKDNFDLVVRRGSHYIFVRVINGVITSREAYKVVDTLSAIAGLRNTFVCIIVGEVIEETAKRLLSEYNIVFIPISEFLEQTELKLRYEISRLLEEKFIVGT